MQIISCSIPFEKIDASKCQTGKDGKLYFNFTTTVYDQPDKYGNHAALTLPQSKEQREAKTPKVYVGNGKVVFKSEPATKGVSGEFLNGLQEDKLPF